MSDPTIRLREIVEAATNGGLEGFHATPDFEGITLRLARAVADPAFVEKVARAIGAGFPDALNEADPWTEQATSADGCERQSQWAEILGGQRQTIDLAQAVLSLLASHALGEGGG